MRNFSHTYFIRLLHLYKESELNRREQRRLSRHLRHCGECKAKHAELQRLERILETANETAPEMPHAAGMTRRIMNEVIALKSAEGKAGLFSPLVSWIRMPKVRLSLAAAAVCIIGVFLVQEAVILTRISRLEQRLTAYASSSPASAGRLKMQFSSEAAIHSLRTRFLSTAPSRAQDDLIEISRSDMEAFMTAYKEQILTNRLLLLMLKEHPLFRDITWENGPDSSDISRLLENRTSIQNYLKTL